MYLIICVSFFKLIIIIYTRSEEIAINNYLHSYGLEQCRFLYTQNKKYIQDIIIMFYYTQYVQNVFAKLYHMFCELK